MTGVLEVNDATEISNPVSRLTIANDDGPPQRLISNSLDRTSDLLKSERSLTLDDIPRIVAAEQAREQRPNAFKHHNLLYQKKQLPRDTLSRTTSIMLGMSERGPGQSNLPVGESSKYYSELSKHEHFILRHIAIEALLQTSKTFSKDELLGLIQTRKLPNFWDKFKFIGGDKHKSMEIFGVDLKDVSQRYGVDSDLGVGPSQLRIPILIDDVIHSLRQKDMSVEGIFRLNGNIKNLRELTEQINAAPLKSPQFSNYSAVQLAALMKKWLRELPNPLLTFNLYDIWIASRREEDSAKQKWMLKLAYCMLPRCNRNLLEVLLYFFSWVATFAELEDESGSKMDTHNLATVIAPNILLSKASATSNGSNQSTDSQFLAIEVVNQLIEIHEELCVIPRELWHFYELCQFSTVPKADTLSTKEVNHIIAKISGEHVNFFLERLILDADCAPSHQNTIKRGQAKVHETECVAEDLKSS